MKKTLVVKTAETDRAWHFFDADGQILGRLASQIAILLIGKHKPGYTPNLDSGDYVVVVNSSKIKVTGRKMLQKIYYRHTAYMGSLKEITLEKLMEKDPTAPLRLAVTNMLPINKLQSGRLNRLKIFADDKNTYQEKFEVKIKKEK
ncbi:MAG: 50S ribosomal protein L13 [Patescibacteria group bacterium]